VVDIIREQAEHQALGAAGLDEDEDLFSPVLRATRRRLIWLSINLGTAFVAAGVVGQFEATIDQLVALAVLMPIVAGMGGNAGTQVLALMVRGLALGQVGASNVRVLLWKELRVALLNGVALGVVLGLVVYAWFGSAGLSLVIATALTCNLLLAASAGVLVPLTLKRLGFDPALASSIFLTTVTDVMGFFTFLGLATLLLLR
jgi:magnesium transporter